MHPLLRCRLAGKPMIPQTRIPVCTRWDHSQLQTFPAIWLASPHARRRCGIWEYYSLWRGPKPDGSFSHRAVDSELSVAAAPQTLNKSDFESADGVRFVGLLPKRHSDIAASASSMRISVETGATNWKPGVQSFADRVMKRFIILVVAVPPAILHRC
jgi:hypothetical protein